MKVTRIKSSDQIQLFGGGLFLCSSVITRSEICFMIYCLSSYSTSELFMWFLGDSF
jgi:hypothetical protein